MLNQEKIEQIYHVIDQIATIYASELDSSFLEAVATACETILTQEVVSDITDSFQSEVRTLMESVNHIDFQKEEIRKAFQLCVLKGFKQSGRPNADVTPDSLGILFAYLIEKLYPDKKHLMIYDPLVGTGNLLATIGNHLQKNTQLIGVDADVIQYRLASSLMGMMDYEDNIFLQDTFTFEAVVADVIVTDFPKSQTDNDGYFPFRVCAFNHANLQEDGYLISVVPDSFFWEERQIDFKEQILTKYEAFGLISLPADLYQREPQSILILKKKKENDSTDTQNKRFLLAELPSLDEREEMEKLIDRINRWFDDRIREGK